MCTDLKNKKALYYVYVLVFKEGNHFKIGKSSKDSTRVDHLNSLYSLDLENSFLFSGTRSNISSLERILLNETTKLKDSLFSNLDGYTEIRDIKELSRVKEITKSFVKLNIVTPISYSSLRFVDLEGTSFYIERSSRNNKKVDSSYNEKSIEDQLLENLNKVQNVSCEINNLIKFLSSKYGDRVESFNTNKYLSITVHGFKYEDRELLKLSKLRCNLILKTSEDKYCERYGLTSFYGDHKFETARFNIQLDTSTKKGVSLLPKNETVCVT